MSTESYLWDKLKSCPRADLERHEDKFKLGVPDVSYGMDGVNGWIELKAYKEWPKGTVKFNNFKSWQRRWLIRRGRNGGRCFVMLIVGSKREAEYLLFHWSKIRLLGELERDRLLEISCYHSVGQINFRKLRPILVRDRCPQSF